MTDNTQPLALMLADRLHHEQPMVLRIDAEHAGEELRRQHARITELEAQLAQRFDAADMATAAAQGFRDGVASVSAQAADRAIEGCPELNMGNYDEVEVERLNDWAIRAHDEIDRLHALAAGQATAQQVVVAGESLAEWAMRATPEEFNTANWGAVHNGLLRARKELEITGVVHAWIGPYIDIARQESMKVAAPAQPVAEPAKSASHGQAPAGATEPTEQQILEAAEKAGLWPNTVRSWIPAFHRYHKELAKAQPAPAQPDSVLEDACHAPPLGWRCTRKAGHEGPCAAVEYEDDKQFVERGMQRIRDAEDAMRYRWLRNFHADEIHDDLPYIAAGESYVGAWALYGVDADKAIDAARKEGEKQ